MFNHNESVSTPEIGICLGVLHIVGNLMTYCVITKPGIPISCFIIQKFTNLDEKTDEWKYHMGGFYQSIKSRLGTVLTAIKGLDVDSESILDIEIEDKELTN